MIDWSKQTCGVHRAPVDRLLELMPDLATVISTFPGEPDRFVWDVKVHMLMPGQYGCIPNWHRDFIPREGGRQKFEKAKPGLPMFLWLSGPPLTQFRDGFVRAQEWVRFTTDDEHRGLPASDFCWRGFIRASDPGLLPFKTSDWQRRHCQVYCDAGGYHW